MGIKYRINDSVIFEPQEKKLTGNRKAVTLSASATYCLTLLIERKGNLVKHDDFYDYVWRKYGMEPTAASLYQNISRLRGSLKEAGIKEDVIKTMARRGFIIPGKLNIVMEKNTSNENSLSSVEQAPDAVSQPSDVTVQPLRADNNEAPALNVSALSKYEYIEKKKKSPSKFKIKLLVCVLGVIVSGVILYYLFPTPADSYRHDFSRDECQFFLKTNSHSPHVIEDFSRTLSLNCSEPRYVYITFYQAADRVTVFTCLKPLSFLRRSDCYSDYFIEDVR